MGRTITRRLGGPATRRRRHRRVLFGSVVLLVVAGALIVLGGRGDGGFDDDAAAVCERYGERIADEFTLLFPEGPPADDAAAAQYLAEAFPDTMEELVADLRALEPPDGVAAIVDDMEARLAELRARPADFVRANPLGPVAERFDDAGIEPCGSGFFRPGE